MTIWEESTIHHANGSMPAPSISRPPSTCDASKEMEHLQEDWLVRNLLPANASVIRRRPNIPHCAEQGDNTGMLNVTITSWCHQDKYGETASGTEARVLEYWAPQTCTHPHHVSTTDTHASTCHAWELCALWGNWQNIHFRTAGATWNLMNMCTGQCMIPVHPVSFWSISSSCLPRSSLSVPTWLPPCWQTQPIADTHSLGTMLYF